MMCTHMLCVHMYIHMYVIPSDNMYDRNLCIQQRRDRAYIMYIYVPICVYIYIHLFNHTSICAPIVVPIVYWQLPVGHIVAQVCLWILLRKDSDTYATVKAALEAGVNFFDNAEMYGSGYAEEVPVCNNLQATCNTHIDHCYLLYDCYHCCRNEFA